MADSSPWTMVLQNPLEREYLMELGAKLGERLEIADQVVESHSDRDSQAIRASANFVLLSA
jgi:hypothetical protein